MGYIASQLGVLIVCMVCRLHAEPTLSSTNPLLESSTVTSKDIPNSTAQPASSINRHLQSYGTHQEPPQNFFSPSPLSSSESSPDQENCSPPPPKKYCTSRVSASRYLDRGQKQPAKRLSGVSVPEVSGASILPPLSQCLECEVKDAEILALRKRIQVMQDHLGMLLSSNTSTMKNGQVYPESDSLSSSPDETIPVNSHMSITM